MYKPDEALKQSIDQWIEANQNDFVRDLAKLVAIPSISVENEGHGHLEKNVRTYWIKQQRLRRIWIYGSKS